MAAEKTTVMLLVLNADLQCPCCYKKVKKLLCKFPQVRSQLYDEKANTVAITVVCCSPHKIRDKLCCKGGKLIKSIEIKEPKQPEKPKEAPKPKEPEKPKEAEKPKETPKPKEAPIVLPEPVKVMPPPQITPHPHGYHPQVVPTGYGHCVPYYDGHSGGGHCNCNHCHGGDGYGRIVPQLPAYTPAYTPAYPTYGCNYSRPCYVTGCDCFREEYPQACVIM